METFVFKPLCTIFVTYLLFWQLVIPSIYLNEKTVGQACEIYDIRTNNMLSSETVSCLFPLQVIPQDAFCLCRVPTVF